MALNADVCATTKMAEGMSAIVVETLKHGTHHANSNPGPNPGINAFVGETLKLEAALRAKL